MGWMKFVMQQVQDLGRIYVEDSTIDLWVLQHGWSFPVRYVPVAAATGSVAVATISPKTAWRLLRAARHPARLAAEHAFDYGRGIAATQQTLVEQLQDLGYAAHEPAFTRAKTWEKAKRTQTPHPHAPGGAKTAPSREGNRD